MVEVIVFWATVFELESEKQITECLNILEVVFC
jgi:hypothetical protein